MSIDEFNVLATVVLSAASTCLWMVTVYFTIRTFREIKRQTDIQSEAFLVVAAVAQHSSAPSVSLPEPVSALHAKWRGIVTKNVPDALVEPRLVSLTLKNRGRSDIASWTVTVRVAITPGEYLQSYNVGGDSGEWTVCSHASRDVVPAGEEIQVPIALAGLFPHASFSWSIAFVDIRGQKYTRFAGDSAFEDSNPLANPTSGNPSVSR